MTKQEVEHIRAVASERFVKATNRSEKSRESTIIRLCDEIFAKDRQLRLWDEFAKKAVAK